MSSFDEVQAARRERHNAIASALRRVDKGEHGRRHHRYLVTTEIVDGYPVHTVAWCFDCGRARDEAEQNPTPSTAYSDHPAVGFCGYLALQPGG